MMESLHNRIVREANERFARQLEQVKFILLMECIAFRVVNVPNGIQFVQVKTGHMLATVVPPSIEVKE